MLYNVEVYFPCYKDVLKVFLTCITVRMFYKKYFTVFILLGDLYQPKTYIPLDLKQNINVSENKNCFQYGNEWNIASK